jgi:surfeit locus 1 family protein
MFRLRLGSRVLAPRLVPTLLVVPVLAALLTLGFWQLGRAAEKRALYASFARDDGVPAAVLPPPGVAPPYLHVTVTGHYRPDRQLLLDNMTHDGAAGYRVLTPFVTADGTLLLVDRGWVPGTRSRSELPAVPVDDGERTLTGRLDGFPRPGVRLAAPDETGWPRRMTYPTRDDAARALGQMVYDRLLLLDPTLADGYVRDWHPGGLTPERHLGYAVQWFALAATLLVLFLWTQTRPSETER